MADGFFYVYAFGFTTFENRMKSKISVIIAYYKNETFLKILLDAFQKQTCMEFEIVIAEDDNTLSESTINPSQYSFPIKHVSQKDEGFRKCRILNKAILQASSDRIAFIDGDCIPHPRFIESNLVLAQYPCVFGRRVMLSKSHTKKILAGNLSLGIVDLIKEGSKKIKHALYIPWRKPNQTENKGIWGCNWSIDKVILFELNGFDEDYTLAGIGEDVDIEWRLRKFKVPIFYAKHRPIVYHMYHKEHYDEEIVKQSQAILAEKKRIGSAFCINGIEKAN